MKRVLLTGAFGNVGANTLGHLSGQGHEVFAFDVQTARNQSWSDRLAKDYRFTSIFGDLRSRESVAQAMEQAQPDVIVHLAAVIAPTAYVSPGTAFDVNVNGTRNLLDAAASSPKTPQFIFASSYSVHGPRNPHRSLPPLTADSPLNPSDNYGRHKAAGEQMVRASGLPWTIIRLPTVLATDKDWGQSPEFFKIAFLLPLDRREHVLDSADAGLALANAAGNGQTVERVLLLGGSDENCRITGHDFFGGVGEARGIHFPPSAFRLAHPDVDESWYYEDWVDVGDSQEILRYQQHSFADYLRRLRKQARFSRPLLRAIRPVVHRQVVKESPYYGKEPVLSEESFWTVVCQSFGLEPHQR
jgi:nucleoside-diphosphate-sugar epimerase